MLPLNYFLFWKWYDYVRRLTANNEQIKRYKERGLRIQKQINDAIKETGIVKNTHQPFDPKKNPRRPVSREQRDVVAWKITAKEGHYAGHRPQKSNE